MNEKEINIFPNEFNYLCFPGSRLGCNNVNIKESMTRDAATSERLSIIKIETIKSCCSYSHGK